MKTPLIPPQGLDFNLRNWLQFLREDVGVIAKTIMSLETRTISVKSGSTAQINNQGNGYVGAIPISYTLTLDVLTLRQRQDGGLDVYAEFSGASQDITFLLVKR